MTKLFFLEKYSSHCSLRPCDDDIQNVLNNFDATTGYLSQASPASAGPSTPSKGIFVESSPKLKGTPDSVQKLALDKAMPLEPASSSKKLMLEKASPKEKMKKEKGHHPKDGKTHKEKKIRPKRPIRRSKRPIQNHNQLDFEHGMSDERWHKSPT